MATHYIDKETGNIYNLLDDKLAEVYNISMISVYSFFNDPYIKYAEPYLENTGWFIALDEKDIEYLINILEIRGNPDSLIDFNEFLIDLKENYKKYQKMALIKNIIE